jgi:hypothetical protein
MGESRESKININLRIYKILKSLQFPLIELKQ